MKGKTLKFQTLRPPIQTHNLPAPAIFPIFRGVAKGCDSFGIANLASKGNTNGLERVTPMTLVSVPCCI